MNHSKINFELLFENETSFATDRHLQQQWCGYKKQFTTFYRED